MSKEGEPSTRKTLLHRSKERFTGLGRKLQDYLDGATQQCENGEYTVIAFYGGGALVRTRNKEGSPDTRKSAEPLQL